MFKFNLKKAAIYQAVKWERFLLLGLAGFFKKLFFTLFILILALFLYGFITGTFETETSSLLLGLTVIILVLAAIFFLENSFFNSKIKKPKIRVKISEAVLKPEKYNLAEFLSFGAAKAVDKSLRRASKKNISEVSSTFLLYFLLVDNLELNFIFSRAILDFKQIKKLLKKYLDGISISTKSTRSKLVYSKSFQNSILDSLKSASKKGRERIEIGDLIVSLAKNDAFFKKILVQSDIRAEDIKNLASWLEFLEGKIEDRKNWWEYRNLVRRGTMAKEWTSGYTITLDQFSLDWSERLRRRGFTEIIGHEKELGQMERVLARSEINNVLLVGEAGTGRKSIVEALASKSYLGQSLPEANYKRIVELNISSLLAKISDRQEVEAILDRIFQEAVLAGNIILVIDKFHNFMGAKEKLGTIDISGVLSSYLSLPQFQIIAITTFTGLHKNIEQNPSVLSLFEKVEISEISDKNTLILLESLALHLEQKNKIFITYPALRDIVSYCSRFLPALPFPEKAMDILDEVVVYIKSKREKVVLPKHVAKIISDKVQIPVGEVDIKEKEVLLNLEDLIHERIINQEEGVREVSSALRRARAEVSVRSGPIGSFLFLGPTGVGKTETAKALAEIYLGSESRIIRLDMSEFQQVKDIPRLLGSPGEEGLLTTKVRENPFSLILLDEIEKAHPNILNLFLQVLDEGHLTDGLGRKVDFKNSIIIATSNAGYKIILKALENKADFSQIKEELLGNLFEHGTFRPEFINRFDAVVIFKPLSKENLLDISQLMLLKLRKNLQRKGIEFVITEPLKDKIVELGYNPTFGARNMKRVIQDKIENVLAKALLSGRLKKGEKVEVEPGQFKLLINE